MSEEKTKINEYVNVTIMGPKGEKTPRKMSKAEHNELVNNSEQLIIEAEYPDGKKKTIRNFFPKGSFFKEPNESDS